MSVGATALVLMLAGLVLLILALASLTIVEWFARLHARGSGGTDVQASAAERAGALLRELLDEGEYQQLMRRGYVDVTSPHDAQRIYRIPGYMGLVRVYEHGKAVRELCLQSVEPLPSADVVVMHKLMILGDESEYLARARQYTRAGPELRYRP